MNQNLIPICRSTSALGKWFPVKGFAGILYAALILGPRVLAADMPAEWAAPPAAIERWQDWRFGLFIHYGPISLKGTEISWSRAGERRDRHENITEGVPATEYDGLYHQFNPTNFNAREWADIAKATGVKYVVLTAKHHDGFVMFDSPLTDYKITRSPFGRDLAAELARACRADGLHMGFYYSPPDWHHPDFFTTNQDRYLTYFHEQVRELLTHYGRVDELWFDATGGDNTPATWDNQTLFPMIRRLQPNIIITKRCGGWGDIDTPEQHIGGFNNQQPWETCMTICQQWSWRPDDQLKSLAECVHTLATCAGGDGNLLLNVGPRPDGTIEPRQAERLREIGTWLHGNGESIYNTRGGPWKPAKTFTSTRRGNTVYLHVLDSTSRKIELPALPAEIKSAKLMTGLRVEFTQQNGLLTIIIPASAADSPDIVVKLSLDRAADSLPVLGANRQTPAPGGARLPSTATAKTFVGQLGDKSPEPQI